MMVLNCFLIVVHSRPSTCEGFVQTFTLGVANNLFILYDMNNIQLVLSIAYRGK